MNSSKLDKIRSAEGSEAHRGSLGSKGSTISLEVGLEGKVAQGNRTLSVIYLKNSRNFLDKSDQMARLEVLAEHNNKRKDKTLL